MLGIRPGATLRVSNRIGADVRCLLLAVLLIFGSTGWAGADDGLLGDAIPVPSEKVPAEPPPAEPTLADLGVDDSGIAPPGFGQWALDTAVTGAATWGLTLAFNGEIRDGVTSSSGAQWLDNISQAPRWDDGSSAVENYVSHPFLGATWFLAYRSRGHGLLASSLGVIFQTVFFEYAIEGSHVVPSARDMLITPLLGIPLGYGLDTLSLYLLKKEDTSLRYLGYVFNPFHLFPSAKKYRWDVAVDPANKSFAVSGRF